MGSDDDARTGDQTMRMLERLASEQGKAVVIVTHDDRIADLADRVWALGTRPTRGKWP